MFQHSLERSKTGAATDKNCGTLAVFTQEESAQRTLDAQHGFFLHLVEHLCTEIAAADIANVQFNEVIIMRRIGNGKRTWCMVLEEHINVLAGKKLQAFRFGHFQINADDVMCQVFKLVYTAGQGSDLDVPGRIHFTDLDGQVTAWSCLAKQRLVTAGIIGIQRRWQSVMIVNRSADDIAHAGAALSIAAAIGQYNALTQCGIEHRLGWLDVKGMTAGLYGNLIGHVVYELNRNGQALSLI